MYELTEVEHQANVERRLKIEAMLAQMPQDDPNRFALSRTMGIGGSDISKLMGATQYGSPYSLYMEKTLRTTFKPGNLQMRVGTFCEELVAQLYSEKTGYKVTKAKTLQSHLYEYLAGNFDRLIISDDGLILGGLECKTAGHNTQTYDPQAKAFRLKWGAPSEYEGGELVKASAEIDPLYYGQVQFYLMLSGLPWWDVAVLISNSDFRVYRVTPDLDYQAEMIKRCHDFWVNNVLADNPPPVIMQDLTTPMSDEVSAEATPEQIEACKQIREIDEQIDALTQVKKSVQDTLAETFLHASRLTYRNEQGNVRTLCTFKSTKSRRFNSTKFKADHPDLYDEYLTETTSARSFRLSQGF